jgi:hypothetical protein
MVDGIILGGMQEGMSERRRFEKNKRIHDRADARADAQLKLDAQKQAHAEQVDLNTRANKAFAELMGTIEETAKSLRAAGRTQAEIEVAVMPLAERTHQFAARFGQDPDLVAARIASVIGRPAEPQTDLAKLETDRRNGFVDEATYRAKLDALSKGDGTTVNIVNAGEKSFSTELNKSLAQEFTERRKSALDAVASMKSNDEALALLNKGVITGAGAEYILQLGKALQSMGVNFASDAIANTEAFVATRAQEVGRIIKLFGAGTGLSDADREFATKAAAGQITLTETSIRRILEINSRASRNIVKAYNLDLAQIDPAIVPWDLRLPEAPTREEAPIRKTIGGKTYERRDGVWYSVGGGRGASN